LQGEEEPFMRIKVLGASGSVSEGENTPAFLLDDFLLLDAGTVSLPFRKKAQAQISDIFLSHAHLDHIKGIPFLVENLTNNTKPKKFVTIYSGKEVIQDLKRHIFNNRIWPDFSVIPSPDHGLLRYHSLSTAGNIAVRQYRIHTTKVNHTVPAYGYLIEEDNRNCLVYSGDSGPTEAIWKRMAGHRVMALIIEVSFPNALRKLALFTGHLTPSLLKNEIKKMPVLPEKIFITHAKFQYKNTIQKELHSLKGIRWEFLDDGMEIKI
jgi:ribonuclease BN (tRNA processing enzyme)